MTFTKVGRPRRYAAKLGIATMAAARLAAELFGRYIRIMAAIRVERMDHVAIDVTDMAATRGFYSGVLGLREIPRPESFDFPGAWFETGSAVLHVVSRGQRDAVGRRHICFFVSNLKDAADAMRAAGFPVTDDGRGTIPGIERFYTVDPDENRVEIQAAARRS